MNITMIGMDLAKNVFQVHGIDGRGKPVLRKQLKRAQVLPFFANLKPCLVGMEAAGARTLGPEAGSVWPHGKAHGSAVREALCEIE